MAIYNEILSARFAKALVKLFSMKGENPTKQLSGEIMAVHPFLNGVENRFHEGWDRFGNVADQALLANNNSAVRFRNPANSGIIAVIESMLIYELNAADQPGLAIGAQAADLGTLVTGNGRLDNRSRPAPSCILSKANTVGGFGFTIKVPSLTAGQTIDLVLFEDQELTLLPGDAYQIFTSSAASGFHLVVSLIWRERNLEDSEKTG